VKRLHLALAATLVLAVADWLGLKRGWIGHRPWVLAALVGVLLLLLVAEAWSISRELKRRGIGRIRGVSELTVVAGLLLASGGGMVNWLLSLQGYVILTESERIELAEGAQLQEFEAGPLSDLEEMAVLLELSELKLLPQGDGFFPESRLVCARRDQSPLALAVRPGQNALCGSLILHQGAFGFAPRIVIVRGETVVFDRVVPYLTRRDGTSGIAFEGDFTLASEGLHVRGAVDLESLDARMRGHARLRLEVSREERLIGRGDLQPGHFAEIEDGYRIGFAGLEKWSEIDVSRRNYGRWVLAGATLALIGAIAWGLALRSGR